MINKLKNTIKRKYKIWVKSKHPHVILEEIALKGHNIEVEKPFYLTNTMGIQLGSNIDISKSCFFQSEGGICIHDNVVIERNVKLITNTKDVLYSPINIEKEVRIGSSSIIYPGVTIEKGSIIPPKSIIKNDFKSTKTENVGKINIECQSNIDFNGELIFVVSTGRSGSKAIISLFEQNPDVIATHEAFMQFGKYAVDKLYNLSSSSETKDKLIKTFTDLSYIDKPFHIQSDQKLGALITELSEIFPKAKFIWLVRNLKDFVNSAYPRGWFDNSEFGYEKNPNEFINPQNKPAKYFASYRMNAARAKVVSELVWKNMTAFERNCWYWNYWNKLIESQLRELPKEKYLKIYLNELKNSIDTLQDFTGINMSNLIVKKTNKAFYKKLEHNEWSIEMENIYKKYNVEF